MLDNPVSIAKEVCNLLDLFLIIRSMHFELCRFLKWDAFLLHLWSCRYHRSFLPRSNSVALKSRPRWNFLKQHKEICISSKKSLLHGCFSYSLNCSNGTKSRSASHMCIYRIVLWIIWKTKHQFLVLANYCYRKAFAFDGRLPRI